MNKRQRKEWEAYHDGCRDILLGFGALETEQRREINGYHFGGSYVMPSRFGLIKVYIISPIEGRGNSGVGWLGCQLNDFGLLQETPGFRWSHWKQNLHFADGTDVDMSLRYVRRHLEQFDPIAIDDISETSATPVAVTA